MQGPRSELLDLLLPGGDNSPAVIDAALAATGNYTTTPAAILTEIAVALIAARAKRKKKQAA